MSTTRKQTKAAPRPASSYADGAPFDDITYLEAKLILKPEPFTSAARLRDFARFVRRAARQTGVGFAEVSKAGSRPEVREVVFLDTPDFALYNNAFILRRRITYEDGFPVGDPEIVFKFRHPDRDRAGAVDVRPQIAGKHRIKFKAEALPLKDEVGGFRILYSHNCQFGLSQTTDRDKTSLATLSRILPPLNMLKRRGEERVKLVNEGIVEEVLVPLGQLDFGKGVTAKCDIALWRTRGEHRPLVGEFAFQVKFAKEDALGDKQRRRCALFYSALQHEVAEWLALGVTKTAMVYRLQGNAAVGQE